MKRCLLMTARKMMLIATTLGLLIMSGCSSREQDFKYQTEQFADLYIARYRVPGFEQLPIEQKKLLYYLYQAALSGRDIYYDQNYKYNLLVRRTLEAIVNGYDGDRSNEDFGNFMVYAKRVWFSNGIHHHYASTKLEPGFSREYFAGLARAVPAESLPLKAEQSVEELLEFLAPILFDPTVAAKKVNLEPDVDQIATSAVNFYEGVTQAEVEAFYGRLIDKNDATPISYGLNSKLVKINGRIEERVWKVGGMYGAALEQIALWLEKASMVASNVQQKEALERLIAYYKSGDLAEYDAYSIAWVQDVSAPIDVISGFIETYDDPLGYRGSFESVVQLKDADATRRIDAIGAEAQWFEDNSPIMETHKKPDVKGITANVVNVVVEVGDASPYSPIGINLPNPSWIRKEHGSKSVSLGNIMDAYAEVAKGNGFLEEFGYSAEEIRRANEWGTLADNLSTDMHEVIGHASGQLEPGVGTPRETLKSYAAVLEEARADLVGLYYILDPKLIEIGVMPSLDVGRSDYDSNIRNGLMTQLTRIVAGANLEQTHMRNRQLVAAWAFEKGQADNVIERVVEQGRTYFVIRDYQRLRTIFGRLLREVQRIKSQGDYEAARQLVETYGVKVDPQLHAEVLERYEKLGIAPYGGFINPRLTAVMKGDDLVDVEISYPDDFSAQMLEYAREYSFLPTYN
ncbi:MAG: dihydrofolate reductase [Candidatus Marinimicrobia bacterium]|nr:dihydrofolate reductase [Candidatus Neomarinimicrobiota bacterium]